MIKASIITPVGENEFGFTAEVEQDRTGTHLIIHRKAGSINGRHYHKGLSATKDPEVLILLSGICTINSKHIDDNQIQSKEYTAPAKFEIPPFVWHELIPVTDCTFMEMNSIAEHAADTFRLDD